MRGALKRFCEQKHVDPVVTSISTETVARTPRLEIEGSAGMIDTDQSPKRASGTIPEQQTRRFLAARSRYYEVVMKEELRLRTIAVVCQGCTP